MTPVSTSPGELGLPIEAARPDVERALDTGRPLIVTAPTGSGKSTRLPAWLGERAERVLVIEPRRVACRALATWVAGEGSVGNAVGYRVRFEDKSSAKTRILFVTPGVALRMIADGLPGDWAVLVDELHERGAQVDLCVALLRARREKAAFPFVLTSATLDAARLQEGLDAELVEASGRTYPVDVRYEGAGAPSGRDLDERVAEAVVRALAGAAVGDVLVFLPGKAEIDAARRTLSARTDAELAVVHAQLPPAELQRALGSRPRGHRRVFLATNVAETSLTIPSVRTVVDSGLVRTRIHRAGRSALALIPCARDQLDQRAGRAGRVSAGTAVRLFDSGWAPRADTAPEISRTELDDLILQAAACGLGHDVERAPWITPPPAFALERARGRLRRLGALDEAHDITARGQLLARAPVSAEHAALLAGVDQLEPRLASALCDLVALMDAGGSLELLPASEEAALARAAIAAPDEVRQSLRYLQEGDARRHGLHRGRLDGARRLARILRELTGVRRADGLPLEDTLAAEVARRLPAAAFALRERAERGKKKRSDFAPYGNSEGIELDLRTFSSWDRELGAPEPEPPKTGLVLAHAWTEDHQGRVRGRGRLFLPCAAQTLADAGVGEIEVATPRIVRGRVVADREVRLGGRLIAQDEAPLSGAALHRAAAALILEGRLVKGSKRRVLDDLHLASVARALDVETAVDPDIALDDAGAYLEARLRQLGVQVADDLSLVEPADLGLTLEAPHLDPHELDRLREDFPRTWTLHGATYDVVVRARQRSVELSPSNGQAKKAQEPKKELVPRFRGFRVEYVKGSRRVRLR